MPRNKKSNTKYSAEFKISVILYMRKHGLGYSETVRRFWETNSNSEIDVYKNYVIRWERIYLEEGELGLMRERRGRKSKGRPRKEPLDEKVENDLIAENQKLKRQLEYAQAEIEYLKKLDALVRAEEQKKNKKQ